MRYFIGFADNSNLTGVAFDTVIGHFLIEPLGKMAEGYCNVRFRGTELEGLQGDVKRYGCRIGAQYPVVIGIEKQGDKDIWVVALPKGEIKRVSESELIERSEQLGHIANAAIKTLKGKKYISNLGKGSFPELPSSTQSVPIHTSTPPAPTATQSVSPSPKSSRVREDFGEKIGGARKDMWRNGLTKDVLDNMNRAELLKYVKKEEIWRKPNYEESVRNGADKNVVYAMKVVRDSITPKMSYPDETPNAAVRYFQEQYVEFVSLVRDTAMGMKTEDDVRGLEHTLLSKNIQREAFKPFYTNKFSHALVLCNFFVDIEKKVRELKFGYSERDLALEVYQVEQYIVANATFRVNCSNQAEMVLTVNAGKRNNYSMTRVIKLSPLTGYYSHKENWEEGSWFVQKGSSILCINLDSKERAEEIALGISKRNQEKQPTAEKQAVQSELNSKEVKPATPEKKRISNESLAKAHRKGISVRNGDASGEDIMKSFRIRGGEYGNWVNEKERIEFTNQVYDAFADLANILGIRKESISLGGRLAIAMGARGRKGSSAHYELTREVINLTRFSGAGSLAHEWFHALDDIVGKFIGFSSPLSENIKKFEVLRSFKFRGLPNKNFRLDYLNILDSFQNLVEVMMKKGSEATQYLLGSNYYKCQTNVGYWVSENEMLARAFDAYILDKLESQGYLNDFLCGSSNIVMSEDGCEVRSAVPMGKERQAINAAFDSFFTELKKSRIL